MVYEMKKTKAKKHTGRPPRHGGFSLMIRRGELPERRGYIRRYLTACREQLIRDLGPLESDLTAAEIIILDRCISKLAVIRMIEEYFAETGVFLNGQLAPVLSADYIRYTESVRRDLLTLGIGRREVDRAMTALEIVKDYAARKDSGEGIGEAG